MIGVSGEPGGGDQCEECVLKCLSGAVGGPCHHGSSLIEWLVVHGEACGSDGSQERCVVKSDQAVCASMTTCTYTSHPSWLLP